MPDVHLARGNEVWLLDTKWKLLNRANSSAGEKYGLSQGDFYQLFAYGQKYQNGTGDLFLIYPRTSAFEARLEAFRFTETSTLWIVAFDLEKGEICAVGWAAPGVLPWHRGREMIAR